MLDTPNTVNYMILGYAFIFGTIAVYLASFIVRSRSLKRDLELLEELDKDQGKK